MLSRQVKGRGTQEILRGHISGGTQEILRGHIREQPKSQCGTKLVHYTCKQNDSKQESYERHLTLTSVPPVGMNSSYM